MSAVAARTADEADLYACLPVGPLRGLRLLVSSDAPSVAYRHLPRGGRAELRRIRNPARRPAGPATLMDAVEASLVPISRMASPLDALGEPMVRDLLSRWGWDGFSAPAGKGHAMVVTWDGTAVETLPEATGGPGRIVPGPGTLEIDLTTEGRQLALELHAEGLAAASASGDPDILDRARRHVAAWLLAGCEPPPGTSLALEGDVAVATAGNEDRRYSILSFDPVSAADSGHAAFPDVTTQAANAQDSP